MGGLSDDSRDEWAPANAKERFIEIVHLGISVTPLNAYEAAAVAVKGGKKQLLLNHNLHSAYLHDKDEPFRRLYADADWVIVDGAPILWLASRSARKSLSADCRITSTDWIDVLPSLEVSRRLFVFGSTADSNVKAIDELRRRLPNWKVSGINGFVDDEVAVKQINDFNPDLVIVGLGMPRQERFLLHHLPDLVDATYATVGGAIDYLAGATRLSPRWVGRFGLEWAWRLALEPRRLAYRYLVEPLFLARRVALRNLRTRRPPQQESC